LLVLRISQRFFTNAEQHLMIETYALEKAGEAYAPMTSGNAELGVVLKT
jgi:hypothetical protein